MLDADTFAEIWSTLSHHKLRTFLTALSVAWGVFVLIVLLGAGEGLQNGAVDGFSGDAVNSVWISTGMTALPHAGQGPGRKIKFDNADYEALLGLRPGVDHVSAGLDLPGTAIAVRYGARRSTFAVHGAMPDGRYLENLSIREGRFLDEDDVRQRRKVAVIGPQVVEVLFGKKSPIGEYFQIRSSNFRVVGVYQDPGGDDDQRAIFVPLSTIQLLNGSTVDIDFLGVTVSSSDRDAGQTLVDSMRQLLAERHHYAKDDVRAARIFNNLERFDKISRMFVWIRVFVWLVGIGTLLAGIVGVSNIMLISIKERTQEIGIRKAIGATPSAIVRMIVGESLLITAVAGYLGLAGGIGVISLANRFMPAVKGMRDPSVGFEVALGATVLIVVAGTLAGYFPARRAAATNPITALRSE